MVRVLYDGPPDRDRMEEELRDEKVKPGVVYTIDIYIDPRYDVSEVFFTVLDQTISTLKKNYPGVMILDYEIDKSENMIRFYFADDPGVALYAVALIAWAIVSAIFLYYARDSVKRLVIAVAEAVERGAENINWILVILAGMVLVALIYLVRR